MRFSACAILALVATPAISAFAPHISIPSVKPVACMHVHSPGPSAPYSGFRRSVLFSTTDSDEKVPSSSDLSDEEWITVKDLVARAADDAAALLEIVAQALPTMRPSLIMKLRKVVSQDSPAEELTQVATALQSVLDSRLAGGRELLATLLNAGEIRKLDAAIGKAAREGKLDVAFFTVLNINMQEAAASVPGDDNDEGDANRAQILQHIYTRCQEEVEKTIPGGAALLNKLLRTQMDSIRANQLEHYLCPQPNVITTPDGKEITLEGAKPVLVPPSEFVDAIAGAVKQIRTVEKAGGTDRESAANMVEACRQVAKEARLVMAKNYGVESEELREFEDALMPVFRPESPESPYIQGIE